MKKDYKTLSTVFTTFIYESYYVEWVDEKLMLHFRYRIENSQGEDLVFHHRVSYEWVQPLGNKALPQEVALFDGLIFHIGLVESINYYKTVCPKRFQIKCGVLSKEQKKWWTKLFYHGLGEFIYLNGIHEEVTESDFVTFIEDESYQEISEAIDIDVSGNLIPVGGGKDSVVTLEILKDEKDSNLPFVLSPPQASYDCIDRAGYKSYLLAKRYFDKTMLLMNEEGYMNGHVPYSAILGFISILGAALTKKQYIPLSNERSADESTVIGMSFNHQYSKSFEFEVDFNDYVARYLIKDVKYFSLLRRLYEVDIAKYFARAKAYHQVFRSCNRGKGTNTWCGHCPKCLFVYIILGPHLPLREVEAIFGKNLLEDESLIFTLEELMGIQPTKPFECVGTIDEVRWSLNQICEKFGQDDMLPVLLKHYQDKVSSVDSELLSTKNSALFDLSKDETRHLIPERFIKAYGDTI